MRNISQNVNCAYLTVLTLNVFSERVECKPCNQRKISSQLEWDKPKMKPGWSSTRNWIGLGIQSKSFHSIQTWLKRRSKEAIWIQESPQYTSNKLWNKIFWSKWLNNQAKKVNSQTKLEENESKVLHSSKKEQKLLHEKSTDLLEIFFEGHRQIFRSELLLTKESCPKWSKWHKTTSLSVWLTTDHTGIPAFWKLKAL